MTTIAAANAANDYLGWSVTAGARTSASVTGLTGVSFKNTLTATSVDLYSSTDNWTTSTLLGKITGTGITAADSTNFHSGTQSFFATPLTLAAGTTTQFRMFVDGSASTSNYIGFDSSVNWAVQGTTSGGAYNLVWNGNSGNVTGGQTGQFTGTDFSANAVSSPTFESGDNVTIGQTGTMNLAGATTMGILTDSNATGNNAIAGGNITAASLSKTGAGTLTLTGSNSFTGGGTISAGTVVAGSSGALGTTAMTLNGGSVSVTDAAVTSLTVPLVLGSSGGTIDDVNNLTLSGAITGAGNTLTKTGAGNLTLSGTLGANKAGVALSFSAGSLDLSGSAKELAGASTFNGSVTSTGTVLNVDGNATIGGSGTLTVNGGSINTVFNSTAGTGGSATINTNVAFANNVSLSGASGKILKFDTGVLSGSGTLTTSGTGGVQFNSTAISTFSGSIAATTSLAATSQSLADVTGIATSTTLTLDNGSAESTVKANITGAGAVTTTGTGTLNLTGTTSSFSGGLTLNSSGAVLVNVAKALGTGTINASNAGSKIGFASTATLSSMTVANAINTGAITPFVMAFAPGAGKSITLSGAVSGLGQLKVSGGGDVIPTNTNAGTQTYSGGTEIGTGRLIVVDDDVLGDNAGAVNFGTATNSHFVSTALGSFSGSRNFTIGSSSSVGYTANIDIAGNYTNTIAGVVANKAGNAYGGNLNKLGVGTLKLTNVNTYTGNTTINSGTLSLSGSGSISASPNIIVGASTTLDVSAVTNGYTLASTQTISGTGTVVGTTGVAGTLSPGNSPGTLSTGSQVWLDGGDYNWQMLDATGVAGTGYDRIAVTGTLDLSSLSAGGFGINLWSLSSILPDVNGDALNFDKMLTQSWTILTTSGGITGFDAADFTISTASNNGTGGFSNALGEGSAFSLGTSGNNLVLTYSAVPEPGAILLGGLGVLALLRRRRH